MTFFWGFISGGAFVVVSAYLAVRMSKPFKW